MIIKNEEGFYRWLELVKSKLNNVQKEYIITYVFSNQDWKTSLAYDEIDLKITAFKEGEKYAFVIPSIHISMNVLLLSREDVVLRLMADMIAGTHDYLVSQTPSMLAEM